MPFNGRIVGNIIKEIKTGNVQEVCKLIKELGEANEELKGHSPLYIACATGMFRWVKFLVEEGKIDINQESKGITPSEIATINAHKDVVEYLEKQIEKTKEIEKQRADIESLKAMLAVKRREVNALKKERDEKGCELIENSIQGVFTKIENGLKT